MIRPDLICVALAIALGDNVRIIRLPALPMTKHEDDSVDCYVFHSQEYIDYCLAKDPTNPSPLNLRLYSKIKRDDDATTTPSWTEYENPAVSLVSNPLPYPGSVTGTIVTSVPGSMLAMTPSAAFVPGVQPATMAAPLAPVAAEVVASVAAGPRDMYSGLPPGAMPRPQNHPVVDGIAQAVASAPTIQDPGGGVRSVFGKARMSQGVTNGPRRQFLNTQQAMLRAGAQGVDMDASSILASIGAPAGGMPGQKRPRVFMKGADGRSRNLTPPDWEKQQSPSLESALTDLLGPAGAVSPVDMGQLQDAPLPPEPPQKPLTISQGGALYGYSAAAGGGAPAVVEGEIEENFDNLPDAGGAVSPEQVAEFEAAEGGAAPAPAAPIAAQRNLQLVPQPKPAAAPAAPLRVPMSPDGDFGAMGGRPA